MELATGHAPYANFSLTNIIIMTMHSPVPELERTFSDVSCLITISYLRVYSLAECMDSYAKRILRKCKLYDSGLLFALLLSACLLAC